MVTFGANALPEQPALNPIENQSFIEAGARPHTHEEIKNFMETNTHTDRMNAYRSKIREAFDALGQNEKPLVIGPNGVGAEIPDGYSGEIFDRLDRQFGEPTIVYKEIFELKDTRNFTEKVSDFIYRKNPKLIKVKTGQVALAINFNNGNSKSNNTVVQAIVDMDSNGQIDMSKATFRLTTEEQFEGYFQANEARKYKDNSAEAKMARGKYTRKEYRKRYREEHGESIKNLQARKERRLSESPNLEMQAEAKREFFERCSAAYQLKLEIIANQNAQKALEEAREEEAYQQRQSEAIKGAAMQTGQELLDQLEKRDVEGIMRSIRMLKQYSKISGIPIGEILESAMPKKQKSFTDETPEYEFRPGLARIFFKEDADFTEMVRVKKIQIAESTNPIIKYKYETLLQELSARYKAFGVGPKELEELVNNSAGTLSDTPYSLTEDTELNSQSLADLLFSQFLPEHNQEAA
jgi:hypothetical protein